MKGKLQAFGTPETLGHLHHRQPGYCSAYVHLTGSHSILAARLTSQKVSLHGTVWMRL